MGRELHFYVPAGNSAELLIELGQVPVRTAHGIGMAPLRQFGMKQIFFQGPSCTTDTGLEVNDDVIQIDHPVGNQRPERILPGRGVTTRPGHQPRIADIVAVEFGQPVNRLGLTFERIMLATIPPGVNLGVPQPEIGAQVDDPECLGQRLYHRLRCGMRQRAKTQIHGGKVDFLDLDQIRQGEVTQVRKDSTHRLTSFGIGGECDNFHRRMGGNEPYEFGARVSRGTQNGDFVGHVRPLSLIS